MGGDHERLVHTILAAFNERDTGAVIAATHPDVVWEPISAAFLSGGEPYRGHEGVTRYIRDITERWDTLRVDVVSVRAAGDAVVALGHATARTRGGEEQSVNATWVVKFRDGLVVSGHVFSDDSLVRAALEDDEVR